MDDPEDDPGRPAATNPIGFVEELDLSECWRLVESGHRGRLSVVGADDAPDIFPLNYVTRARQIYCRTAPGMKVFLLVRNPRVAFEVDGDDADGVWSVVVRGIGWQIDDADDVARSGVQELVSSAPPPRQIFLRIAPLTVAGRRLRAGPHPRT